MVLHTLVQRTVYRQGLFVGVVPINVGPQQNQTVHLIGMVGGKSGGHGPAHGVPRQVPMPDIRELFHHLFCGVGIKNGHTEGHVDQDAGHTGPADLVQQGKIGFGLHLCTGIKDGGGIRRHGRGQHGQIVLHGNAAVPGHTSSATSSA